MRYMKSLLYTFVIMILPFTLLFSFVRTSQDLPEKNYILMLTDWVESYPVKNFAIEREAYKEAYENLEFAWEQIDWKDNPLSATLSALTGGVSSTLTLFFITIKDSIKLPILAVKDIITTMYWVLELPIQLNS